MTHKKIVGKTPSCGDYSEIFYFDDAGNPEDDDKATKCVIRKCKEDGTLINEVFGVCLNDPPKMEHRST